MKQCLGRRTCTCVQLAASYPEKRGIGPSVLVVPPLDELITEEHTKSVVYPVYAIVHVVRVIVSPILHAATCTALEW